MASPNKIKNVGYDYKPFQMKASGKKYNNSPIEKNYGSPAQRGFDFTGGVGSKEMEGGVGSAFDYASPAKGWFSNIAKKIGNVGKNVAGKIFGQKGGGGENPAVAQSVAGAGGGGVQPHGDEMHTGGGGGGVGDVGGDPIAQKTKMAGVNIRKMMEMVKKSKEGGGMAGITNIPGMLGSQA